MALSKRDREFRPVPGLREHLQHGRGKCRRTEESAPAHDSSFAASSAASSEGGE